MILKPEAQRAVLAAACAVVAAIYLIAWLAPAIGLFHDDAVYLETAKSLAAGRGYVVESLPATIPQTKYPPFWPGVLSVFVLVSQNPLWVKVPSMLCTAGWLLLSYRLLRKMGSNHLGAVGLVLVVAASPTSVFLASHLMSEPLFALLVTASMIAMLDDRPLTAGAFAGMATITRGAGLPLLAATFLILVAGRRLRSAALFTAAATAIVAPWLGWALAHPSTDPYYGIASYAATSILTSLKASEKLHVLGLNAMYLASAPWALLTGSDSLYAAVGTVALYIWALFRRRQVMPDLFIVLYCAMLLCWAGPPQRFMAPVLPLVLWILWRAFQSMKHQELLTACIIVAISIPMWVDLTRIPDTRRFGDFPSTGSQPNDWHRMQLQFDYIREHTPADAVILANLDPVFYLNTGRKAVRGFLPDGYKLYYAPSHSAITPDQLAAEIIHNGVSYVALTPDRDFAEASAFHRAVEALARGGMLEAVDVPGAGPDYRLLRTVSFHLTR